jgi:hypothetical protein
MNGLIVRRASTALSRLLRLQLSSARAPLQWRPSGWLRSVRLPSHAPVTDVPASANSHGHWRSRYTAHRGWVAALAQPGHVLPISQTTPPTDMIDG